MTREAKIGLLVALAFILVIGILLSDHVTSATRPASAPLAMLEGNIREGNATPGGAAAQPVTPPKLPGAEPQPPETTTYVHPAPQQGTPGEINVGLATPQGPQRQPVAEPVAPTDPWTVAGAAEAPTDSQPTTNLLSAEQQALQDAARPHGETLVPVGDQPSGAAQGPAPAGVKQYTIQSGDSLSKITAKFLGRYTPANEAIILALNPKLKTNPNRIVEGETCLVPATAAAVEKLRASNPPLAGQTQRAQAPANRSAAGAAERAQRPAASTKTYTVKDGDTLWSIAQSQLGSGARHKDILKLNADKIASADEIEVGMKLKLPS